MCLFYSSNDLMNILKCLIPPLFTFPGEEDHQGYDMTLLTREREVPYIPDIKREKNQLVNSK